MKVTVRVDVERYVREAAGRLVAQVANPITLAVIDAARRGEVVELGAPAEVIAELNRENRLPARQRSRGVRSVKHTG